MNRILIIDDKEALREILKKILLREGFVAVETAKDGMEALGKLKVNSYQLLITDLRMPVKGGAEMLAEIEKIQPKIKIIIATGYPLDPAIQEKLEQGRYAYFTKPFENAKLIEKVKELIG